MKDYRDFLAEVLIPEDKLQKRITELGAEISRDYAGKEILLICILRGGVMFLTDLIRHIDTPLAIEFMAVSSYGVGGRESQGQVRITLDLNCSIQDKHVILVEDIIDSGHTLASVIELLETRDPASLCICTLLDKVERREVNVPVKYTGFTIPNKFVFGYGLDIDDFYRNLPFIGVVDLERYQP
ncbi:hypoxanthine phosphoribosyltransferase [Leptolinea tardivitalis]|uniref:Hypoxanthine phosphoribosyltransferase n=1 Tax=Leptolinea tardivitalis TaxID=229920 RepID=A0A0N8GL87_9CHLR|nr:hypoxanthine phosphoribosyltransferase [Leptolinea tardivitalis]KPL71810.1 hypoxanthine phosphoribosyltransferase [Leptolinea tardivitalis]GAP20192.1 hypoxanthine phosphoribosyltransferase [Leptolinea tardivitalis]